MLIKPCHRNANHIFETQMQILKHIIIFISVLLLGACFDEGNCLVNFTDKVIVDFKNQADGTAATIVMDSVSVDGISLLNYEGSELTKVELPVNPQSLTSSFIFYYQSSADTLVVAYQREAVILTSGCGASNYVTGLSIASTDLEDVRIVGTKLLKDVKSHVEIYF